MGGAGSDFLSFGHENRSTFHFVPNYAGFYQPARTKAGVLLHLLLFWFLRGLARLAYQQDSRARERYRHWV